MLWDSRSWITDYYNETGDLTTYYKGMEIGEIWGFRTAGIYASNADALNGPATTSSRTARCSAPMPATCASSTWTATAS